MKVLGITGGIGAGKSTVLSYLEEKYHARVIQADLTARQLQQPGGVCFRNIVEEFGREILNREGNLDREKLSKTVFSDLGKLKRLNELVHPYVKEEIKRQIEYLRRRFSGQVCLIDMPDIAISSRDVRKRRKNGLPIRYYVPDSVYEYIMEHQLYIS